MKYFALLDNTIIIFFSVNVAEGHIVYRMKRSWGKFYWISADVTINVDTPDNTLANIFPFCIDNCGLGETLFSIIWGEMLEISGDFPRSTFSFTYVHCVQRAKRPYLHQTSTNGREHHPFGTFLWWIIDSCFQAWQRCWPWCSCGVCQSSKAITFHWIREFWKPEMGNQIDFVERKIKIHYWCHFNLSLILILSQLPYIRYLYPRYYWFFSPLRG